MKSRTAVNNVRISTKDAVTVGRRLHGKYVSKAKTFLAAMASGRQSLGGKHYTKTCKELLTVLNTAEKNAIDMDMDEERLVVASVNCSPGTRITRQRWRGAGSRMKMTNVVFVLTQASKPLKGKKEKTAEAKAKTSSKASPKPSPKGKKEVEQDYDESIAGTTKTEKKPEKKEKKGVKK